MKWTFLIAAGALAGGMAYVAHQRNRKAQRDAALWAAATDPVGPAAG